MDGHDILQEAAGLIRQGWCRDADARDHTGRAVSAFAATATAWSLTGALAVVAEMPGSSLISLGDALWGISGVIPDSVLDDWNNAHGRKQTDVLQMLEHSSASLTRRPPPPATRASLN
jgi:hypothetical protein